MNGYGLVAHDGGVTVMCIEFAGGMIPDVLEGSRLQDKIAFLLFHRSAFPLQRLYIFLQLRIQFLPRRIRNSKLRCDSRSGRAPRSISPNSLLRGAFRFCGTGNGRSRFCGTGNRRSRFCCHQTTEAENAGYGEQLFHQRTLPVRKHHAVGQEERRIALVL